MAITYSDDKNLAPADLEQLFSALEWLSAGWPQRLARAMRGSGAVYTAWDGGRLVGLANAIDDGALTAYVHYLLVHPDYQGRGIGGQLMARVKEKYADYLYLVLISETEKSLPFYQRLGFEPSPEGTPMYVKNLGVED